MTIAVPAATNAKRIINTRSRRESLFILPSPPRPQLVLSVFESELGRGEYQRYRDEVAEVSKSPHHLGG
jgi:hypothetical protein